MFKTNEEIIIIQAKAATPIPTGVVFWSHDKGTAKMLFELRKDGASQSLAEGTIVPVVLDFNSDTAENGRGRHIYHAVIEDAINGIVSIVLEDNILGYVGRVEGSIYIELPDSRSLDTAGRFTFDIRRSPIDETTPELEDFYWQGFNEILETAKELIETVKSDCQKLLNQITADVNTLKNQTTAIQTKQAEILKSIEDNELATKTELEQAKAESSANVIDQVDQLEVKIDTKLVNKADKTQVTKVEDMISKMPSATPKETFSNLAALQAKYPTGNTSAMVVLEADGKTGYVYLWNGSGWQKGSIYQAQAVGIETVDLTKTTFSSKTTNLFDKFLAEKGKYPVWDTGKLQDNTDFSASDYIPIEEGKTYVKTDAQQIAFYSSKDLSSYVSGISTVQDNKFVVPSGAKYVRLAVSNSSLDSYMLVQDGELPEEYIPARVIASGFIKDVPGKELINDSVGLEKVSFSEESANIFDKNAIIVGRYPVWNTGLLQENDALSASDYIPIEEGKTYVKTDTQQIAFYSSKDLSSYVSGISTVQDNKFTVPKNKLIAYVRLAVINTLIDSYMLAEGEELPDSYVPNRYIPINAMDPKLIKKINSATGENKRIIDSKGRYDYQTIQEFVDNENTAEITGYILNGEYEEQLEVQDRKIMLEGESKNGVVIYNTDGRYEKPPINFGWGSLKNLTVEARYVSGLSTEIASAVGSYGIHVDSPHTTGKSIEFSNLIIKSDFFPAIGCGLRENLVFEMKDTYLKNAQVAGRGAYVNEGTLGALYLHDDNKIGDKTNQKFIGENLVLESSQKNALCIFDLGKENSEAEVTFIDCLLFSHVSGKEAENIWYRGKGKWENTFKLNPLSYRNSNGDLNG